MTEVDEIIGFLKQNIKQEPKRILDVACGYGELVETLSSNYPSKVFGLDINRQSLAIGIARGKFKNSVPICGNAYNLGNENSRFSIVHLDPQYFGGRSVDWQKLEDKELKEPLTNFDLVTTVNPVNEIPTSLFYRFQLGELKEVPIPLNVISIPTKKGGHVLYQIEIAHTAGMNFRPTPGGINEKSIEEVLSKMKKEGESSSLDYVSHKTYNTYGGFMNGPVSTELAVLFKKPLLGKKSIRNCN